MEPLRTVRVGDIDVAFRSEQPARPTQSQEQAVVFVHGLGEDSRSWQTQLAHFGATRAVYAVDVRGHGGSSLGDADGTLDQLADDLRGFLREVAGPSTCVGFSMGGAIVLAAAAERSDLIQRAVVVCSSSVVGSRVAERFLTRAEGIETGGARFAADALRANLDATVQRRPADWASQVAMRVEAIGNGKGYGNGARAMASMNKTRLTDRLSAIEVPVDVLVGELDESCPWRVAEIITEAVPDGQAHLMPGVGHFVNIEDPDLLTKQLSALIS